MADLHVIVTESGDYGWTFETPQIPELIGGRDTTAEIIAELPAIVEWAKEPGETFDQVFAHEQHQVRDPEGNEYLIRFQFNGPDKDYEARHDTAGRINYAVLNGLVTEEERGQHPPVLTTGERLYVCVRDADTLGWIQDQLLEREVSCLLVQHSEDGALLHVPYGRTGQLQNGIDTDALGLNRDSTFAEMAEALFRREVESLRRTYSAPEAVREFDQQLLTPT